MRVLILLIGFLFPVLLLAAPSDMRDDIRSDAPDKHIVVKGDTLWDIAGKFFNSPWRWPEIWGFNKDRIKDPHWIYPGDVIYLDRATGRLQFGKPGDNGIVKLSPSVRESISDHDVIPSIPAKDIRPFLSRPLVVDEWLLESAPTIIGMRDKRVMIAEGDKAFVKGIDPDNGEKWQIFRPGKTFVDPETKEVLGIESIYLGDAEVTQFDDLSTIRITNSEQEIYAGDRLVLFAADLTNQYLPRAPAIEVDAKVISIYEGMDNAGQNTIITLNQGQREGLEKGFVLALSRAGETVEFEGEEYTLPPEQYGMLFVFRVFEKVSYALVLQTRLPVRLMDGAQNPR